MGRAFIRENLQKGPPSSSLFSRDNYQYLEKNSWSLSACEQVLHNHQGARKQMKGDALVVRQLTQNIQSAESLEQLQGIVTRHAHQMNGANFAVAIQRVPRLLLKPDGTPDYTAAALVMDQLAGHMKRTMNQFNGDSLCRSLAAFVKCRYSPPADLLQDLLAELMANNGHKIRQTKIQHLAQLLLALGKLVQPHSRWPIMQAVLDQTTAQLQLLNPEQQKATPALSEEQQQMQQQMQQQLQQKVDALTAGGSGDSEALSQQMMASRMMRITNSLALMSYLLNQANTTSPEYLRAMHEWLSRPSSLEGLYPNAAAQLWQAAKGQYTYYLRQTADAAAAGETNPASTSSSSSSTAGAETAAAADGDSVNAAADEADDLSASATGSTEQQQQQVEKFFGPSTLQNLATATVPLISSMTERELGQVLSSMGRLRFSTPDLLASTAAAFNALAAVKTPSLLTMTTACWAASRLQQFDPALIQPALLAAVTQPGDLDGFLAARVLIATSNMPPEVMQQQQELLRQELHHRSGARGPPTAVAAADAAAAATPEWVTALADNLAGRVGELRPREIAYTLLAYSQIPGVALHENLFTAAALHIEVHAHTFTQFSDMEMIATAFERMDFKDGVPALKALQQQTEDLMARQA